MHIVKSCMDFKLVFFCPKKDLSFNSIFSDLLTHLLAYPLHLSTLICFFGVDFWFTIFLFCRCHYPIRIPVSVSGCRLSHFQTALPNASSQSETLIHWLGAASASYSQPDGCTHLLLAVLMAVIMCILPRKFRFLYSSSGALKYLFPNTERQPSRAFMLADPTFLCNTWVAIFASQQIMKIKFKLGFSIFSAISISDLCPPATPKLVALISSIKQWSLALNCFVS